MVTTARRHLPLIRTAAIAGLILLLVLIPAVARPDPLRANEGILARHSYTFGQKASFTLELSEAHVVSEARLFLSIQGSETRVYSVPVVEQRALYERDLHAQPLQPFTSVRYWWEFVDESGSHYGTERQLFSYIDNRYDWQALSAPEVNLYWVAGDVSLIAHASDVAQTALGAMRAKLDTDFGRPIEVYVYPSLPDLQSALRLSGQTWVEGMAFPELDVVLVAITPGPEAITRIRRVVPHELAHKMHYEMVGPIGFASQPHWLREGLATYFEASPDPAYGLALQLAKEHGDFLPLDSLCHSFPASPRATLAYAQSGSLLTYLEQHYGWSKIRELIHAYADGLGCSQGLEHVLQVNLMRLERDWQTWLHDGSTTPDVTRTRWIEAQLLFRDSGPWLLLAAMLVLPGLLFILTSRPTKLRR